MKVRISKLTAYKIEELLEYLEKQWSPSAKEELIKKLDEKIQVLSQHPLAFPQSTIRPELRKLVITPQTTALYKVEQDHVFIVTLIDKGSRKN